MNILRPEEGLEGHRVHKTLQHHDDSVSLLGQRYVGRAAAVACDS